MEEVSRKIICQKIKELRKKHGYSQEDLAILLNMEQNTYSRLERGETKIDIERLAQIAQLYKVSIHDLLEELLPPRSNKEVRFQLHPQRLINSILYLIFQRRHSCMPQPHN
jgi:transcriptional regulator with XRE-family HTH domain